MVHSLFICVVTQRTRDPDTRLIVRNASPLYVDEIGKQANMLRTLLRDIPPSMDGNQNSICNIMNSDTFQILHCPPPVLKVAVHIVGEANYQAVQFQKLLISILSKSLVVSSAGHSNANATVCVTCNKVSNQLC